MKKLSTPLKMLLAMFLSIAAVVGFFFLNNQHDFIILKYIRDIFIIISFQLIVNFISAPIIFMTFHMKFNYEGFWFRQKSFEPRLYKLMKVKQWKHKMPSYDSGMFSLTEKSGTEIIMNMCHSEAVHELIAVLGFFSVLLCFWGLNIWLLVVTSLLFFCIHMSFVVIQRYNRPRIIKLLSKRTPGMK